MGGYIICRQDDNNTFAGVVTVIGVENLMNTPLFTGKINTLLPSQKPSIKSHFLVNFWSMNNTENDGKTP